MQEIVFLEFVCQEFVCQEFVCQEFVFQEFVCQEFVLQEFVLQEFVFQEFIFQEIVFQEFVFQDFFAGVCISRVMYIYSLTDFLIVDCILSASCWSSATKRFTTLQWYHNTIIVFIIMWNSTETLYF